MPATESAQEAIVDYLSRSGAEFVQDVLRSPYLRSYGPALEDSLDVLSDKGTVLVRPHSAGDPHLDGADLRIVALVRSPNGGDGLAWAVSEIEKTWQSWLAEFLANHRCS